MHTSWPTVRDALRTHQVVTAVLPAQSGGVLRIPTGTTPEPEHRQIHETLEVPMEVMRPVRSWMSAGRS
mgnify:FL=1